MEKLNFDEIEAGLRAELQIARAEVARLDDLAADYTVDLDVQATAKAAMRREAARDGVRVVESKLSRLSRDRAAAAEQAEQEAHAEQDAKIVANRDAYRRIADCMQDELETIWVFFDMAVSLDEELRELLGYGSVGSVLTNEGVLVMGGHLMLMRGDRGRLLQRQMNAYLAYLTKEWFYNEPNPWRKDLRGMVQTTSDTVIGEWRQYQAIARAKARQAKLAKPTRPAAGSAAALHVGA